MKRTFTNIVNLFKTNKKNSILVACSVVLVAVVTIMAAVSTGERGKVEVDTSSTVTTTAAAETTTADTVDDTDVSETTTTETTTETPTVSTTEATTVKHKVENTTNKQNNNKVETTTKKPSTNVTETTTKKNTEVTFNGYKPYEVFVDEDGDEVYYNDFGRLCVAEPTTAEPDPDYDASYCHECGRKDCRPSMDSYYCEICGEDVSALECHPASHFYARFED